MSDRVLEDLQKYKVAACSADRYAGPITFSPYMVGGDRHVYTLEEIKIMEDIIQLGSFVRVNGACNQYRDTPLHNAYFNKNQPMINFLLEHGADPTVKRGDGKIPSEM